MKNLSLYIIIATITLFTSCNSVPSTYQNNTSPANIFPDYSGISIPCNMAPLNFKLTDGSDKAIVTFASNNYKFKVKADNSVVQIPISKWKKLLKKSAGDEIKIDIYSKAKNRPWGKYPTITNKIEKDSIDNYIVYRNIGAGYILWEKMGIMQRSLTNFDQSPILLNDETNGNCMNCHSFCKNDPSKMVIHLRQPPSGTLLYNNGEVKFINLKTKNTMSAGVYPSWHPDGKKIAFSVNIIRQKFHTAGKKDINVYDQASDIIVYDIDKNEVTTTPKLSTQSMENLPNWSPDGEYLYYISAPKYSEETPANAVKYDLLRIKYNQHDGTWGNVDTLLRSKDTGKSISFPEISPDGKHLVFCMAEYGYFTIFQQNCDLYMMNLDNFSYSKMPVNSESVESFHSWSNNGKWLLFVSKRLDNFYSSVYFCHVDENGNVSKPFILPQEDPNFYDHFTQNFNRPVFIRDKETIKSYKLSNKAFSPILNANFDPKVDVDALSGATRLKQDNVSEHTN